VRGHFPALRESGFQIIGQIFSCLCAVAKIHAVLSGVLLQDKAERLQLVRGGLKNGGVVHGGGAGRNPAVLFSTTSGTGPSTSGEQRKVNLQHPDALVILIQFASAHAFGGTVPKARRLNWRPSMIYGTREKSVNGTA
jgi:hypothetical protein